MVQPETHHPQDNPDLMAVDTLHVSEPYDSPQPGLNLQAPPGSQASSRGEAKDSALLSSHDAGLLEPPERAPGWPQLRSGLPFGPRSQASLHHNSVFEF